MAFLLKAIVNEPYSGNVVRLDRVLCLSDEGYKTSFVRERALNAITGSKVAKHKAYATGNLRGLRELPESKRTRMDAVNENTIE